MILQHVNLLDKVGFEKAIHPKTRNVNFARYPCSGKRKKEKQGKDPPGASCGISHAAAGRVEIRGARATLCSPRSVSNTSRLEERGQLSG